MIVMLYRIEGSDVRAVDTIATVDAGLFEKDVENWVERCPEILGEELLIVGRQVGVDDGKDRIDLLAIDKQGSLVIIELKRDLVGGDADLQALRYAASVSSWSYDQVKTQAEGYWTTKRSSRGTLAQEIEAFCDEGYEINEQQRVVIAGRDVKARLGSMALWLRKQGVDIQVSSVQLFEDRGLTYLQPQVVIPPPSEDRFSRSVSVVSSDKPWLRNGEQWHLEQRASQHGRLIIEAVVALVTRAAPEASGPHWRQKYYISWKDPTNRIWAKIHTGSPNVEYLIIKNCPFSAENAALALEWEVFDVEADLSEKLAQGSSVKLEADGSIRFGIKSANDVAGNTGVVLDDLLKKAWAHHVGDRGDTGDARLRNTPP